MNRPIRAAILGGSGYGAGELLRLLTFHPAVEVVSVTSGSHTGRPLAEVHPHLSGFYDLELCAEPDLERLLDAPHSVIFSALPHATSGATLARLMDRLAGRGAAVRFIDLSGDLRIRDLEQHARCYPETPPLESLRGRFEYGLPELFRARIRAARCVANPGCLASAAILAAAPLVAGDAGPMRGRGGAPEHGADRPWALEPAAVVVVDVKTGSSGSGRTLKETTHHPTRHADFRAYRPLAHPHEGEILQAWGDPGGRRIQLSFVAQSMDVTRGIFATVHLTPEQPVDLARLYERYRSFYADSPFIRLREQSPTLQDVVGSNFCDIALACRGRQVIAMAALDNLVKGAAGTALQNMNLMCGLPETTGLWHPSLRPV